MDLSFENSVSINGKPYKERKTISGDNYVGFDHGASNPLAAAKPGTLTTRTDNTDGVITLTAGHGLSTGTFDIFWEGGSRRGVSATIATNACTITGGTTGSTALPVATTAVTVAPIETENLAVAGDDVKAIAIYGSNDTNYAFYNSTPTLIAEGRIEAGNSYIWHEETGADNPLAGETVATIKLSQGGNGITGKARGVVLH